MVVAVADDYDNASTARYTTWTNAGLTSLTERFDNGSATQNGGGIGMAVGTRATAGNYGTTTVTAVTAILANVNGSFALAPESRPVYISPSSNVTDGAATTAQLTPPSGKTTSNFTAGAVEDTANGGTSTDIAANGYTEREWCLKMQAPATVGDIYQFRVYAGTTALDTYSVTPQLTVTAVVPTQQAFRWRNDDGDEDGATWKAAQDTNASTALATGSRLRVLLDTAADVTVTPTLRYKKTSDSTWLPVPVGPGGGTTFSDDFAGTGALNATNWTAIHTFGDGIIERVSGVADQISGARGALPVEHADLYHELLRSGHRRLLSDSRRSRDVGVPLR